MKSILPKIYAWLLPLVLCATVVNIKAATASVILLSLFFVLEGKWKEKFQTFRKDKIAILFTLYGLLHIFSLLYTNDIFTAKKQLEYKAALLFLPFIFSWVRSFFSLRIFLILYNTTLVTVAVFCLYKAVVLYNLHHNIQVFFYHELGAPLGLHAIFWSLWNIVGIYALIEYLKQPQTVRTKVICGVLFVFLHVVLALLSSKMLLVAYAASIPIYFLFTLKNSFFSFRNIGIGAILLASLIFIVLKTPIAERFKIIKPIDWSFINQEKFSSNPEIFDGLTLRLVFWRFGFEILSEKKAWPIGLSSGDAQNALNQKISATNMFTGSKETGETGFINFNFHNQYIETLVKFGIFGLSILLSIIIISTLNTIKYQNTLLLSCVWIFSCFFFTEAVLERQMGLFTFLFCILVFKRK